VNDRLIVWYPIEHGKTTQAKMTLCRLLGRRGDQQFAYVSSKAKQAAKVVGAVKREIESNAKLRQVYPDLKPQRNVFDGGLTLWGTTALAVAERPPGIKDPSLAAYGLDGDILGSRLHGVVIDNGLDKKNTRSSGLREWAREVIEDEIIGRVHEGGFVWILDTAWHEDDFMHVFARRGWPSVRLDATMALDGSPGPLWPEQFSQARLDQRLEDLGPTAFDRQYRNKPLSQSMGFFKREFWDLAVGRCLWVDRWPEPVPRGVQLRTGVDLAVRKGETHDYTAFVTVEASGHRRKIINVQAERLVVNETLARMVSIYRNIHRPINLAGGDAKFVVEDNAAQQYVVDMMNSAATLRALGLTPAEAGDIRVVGRTTTASKREAELGVQGLASALETGRYDIASHRETDLLYDELKTWTPDADHYGDRTMAWWIAASDLVSIRSGTRVDFI